MGRYGLEKRLAGDTKSGMRWGRGECQLNADIACQDAPAIWQALTEGLFYRGNPRRRILPLRNCITQRVSNPSLFSRVWFVLFR